MSFFKLPFGRVAAIGAALCLIEKGMAQRPLGIDVSSFQPGIDWTQVAGSGIQFAWAKAAEGTATDGWIGQDPVYIYNVTHAASAGVIIGSYYYCHPESDPGTAGADAEAAFFWSVANPYLVGGGKYLQPMLDFEQDVTGAGYTAGTLSAWLNEWCNDIQTDGASHGNVVKPVVYTFISYANGTGGYGPGVDSTVTQWGLDMANVNFTESQAQTGAPAATYPWSTWAFWQYNWYGTVPGINTNVDLDVFNGTFASMQNYVIGGTNASFWYWDPQGTTGGNPYTGGMSGTWESASWTTNSAGQASPGAWPEGNAVVFGVNTGLGTPAYTVTANSNHTFSGMFDGPLNPNSCTVTVNGTGVLTLALGPQGFSMIKAADGSTASITVSNVIAGASQVVPEGFGTLSFYGANTFSGGMLLGYPGNAFTGTINFNNNASFGTGAITLGILGAGATFAVQGSSAITIANAFMVTNSVTNIFIGNPSGATYSGVWNLGGNLLTFLTGGTAGNLDTISGVISGTAGLTVGGSGTLALGGANTYSGYTTLTGGTLKLVANNSVPAGSSFFLANGTTFDMSGRTDSVATLGSPLGGTLPAGNVINNNSGLIINGTGMTNSGQAGSSAYSGVISGAGGVTITGGGSATLSGANTYGGTTTVSAGSLMPGFNGALPSGSPVVVNGAGVLDIASISQSIASLSGPGTVYLESGTLTVGNSSSTTFSGNIANAAAPYNNGSSINGLQGFYFPNYNFTSTPIIRTDASVNFSNLATNTQPLYPQITEFSIRWLGQLLTSGAAGTYTFTTTSDDGTRLWVNGKLVVDNWNFQPAAARSGSITLAANTKYDLRLDYEQGSGGASCVLNWTPPGGSSVVIANSNLFTHAGAGGLVKTGSGALTLSGTSAFTGTTAINSGSLILGSAGSINGASEISVAPAATFDVSAIASFNLSANTTLSANGNSAAPATIKGGTTVNLGSQPIILTFDGVSPSLTISQGTLTLNGNACTVNTSIALPGGAYTVIHQNIGNITSAGNFSVTGTAIPATGATGAISVSGGNVILTVTDSTTTTLNPPTASTYGQPASLTATVAPASAGGTVQFYDNGVALGMPVAVASGTASYTTNTLAVGNHPITATYSGMTGFAGSSTTGPSIQQVILPSNSIPVTISGTTVFGNGTLQLNFAGVPGYTYDIQSTSNLDAPANWTNVSTNTADINGLFNFTDVNNTNYPALYYRTAAQ